ncbi:MAG: trigger factor [Alphaproteobacteria bacterium]|nr:trigger factor [Alphaproteobacteria bacterium]
MAFTVTQEKVEGLSHFYEIKITANVIESHMDKEVSRIQETAQVPGFRKGKVPVAIIKKRYGESLVNDTINHVIQDAVFHLFQERKIRPALTPDLDFDEYEDGKDFVFKVTLETYPETPDIDFSKLELERSVVQVDEAEITKGIDRLAQWSKFAKKIEDASHKAEDNDEVTIDFVGKIDGVAFEGGTASGSKLILGSNTFIPGFEDQLKGAKVGDQVTVKVDFPADYHSTELAGKPAEFDVTVQEIAQMHVPEINDEYAKNQGYETLDALREQVKKVIESDYQKISRAKLKRELFDILDKQYQFEIPAKMVGLEFDSLWNKIQKEREHDEELKATSEEDLRKEYQEMAARRVRLGILLSDTGRKNNINVTEGDIQHAIIDQLKNFRGNPQMLVDYYRNNEQARDYLKGPILEEKVVDFIMEKAPIKEKTVPAEELVKLVESGEVVVS